MLSFQFVSEGSRSNEKLRCSIVNYGCRNIVLKKNVPKNYETFVSRDSGKKCCMEVQRREETAGNSVSLTLSVSRVEGSSYILVNIYAIVYEAVALQQFIHSRC